MLTVIYDFSSNNKGIRHCSYQKEANESFPPASLNSARHGMRLYSAPSISTFNLRRTVEPLPNRSSKNNGILN